MDPPTTEDRRWEAAAGLFRSLASPVRIHIVTLLAEGPRSVGELVEHLDVSQPLVSQHLKVLRENCLVRGERRGREVRYRLMDEHVGHIVADGVAHIHEHDPDRPGIEHDPPRRDDPLEPTIPERESA